MGYLVTKALKSLVGTAAIAISLCGISAPANAEMIRYEFIQATNASDLLSGFFNYNDATDMFGDVGISVDFGGSIGQVVFSAIPSFVGKDQANPGFSLSSWAFGYNDVFETSAGDRFVTANMNFAGADLLSNIPIVGPVSNVRWEATAESRIRLSTGGFDIEQALLPDLVSDDPDGVRSISQGDQTGFLRSAFAVSPVPEPSTYAMMAIGLLGIAGMRRRQNKA